MYIYQLGEHSSCIKVPPRLQIYALRVYCLSYLEEMARQLLQKGPRIIYFFFFVKIQMLLKSSIYIYIFISALASFCICKFNLCKTEFYNITTIKYNTKEYY